MNPAYDVVFGTSTETIDDMARRQFVRPPDRLLQHLLTSTRVGHTLVVHPWRSRPLARLKQIAPSALPEPLNHSIPLEDIVRPMRVRRHDPSGLAAVGHTYRRYSKVVADAVTEHGLRRPAFVTYNPLVAAHIDPSPFHSVTYVGRDDWASYPPHRKWWPAYNDAYRRLRENGTRVAAVSEVLLDRISPSGPALVVPNGVDRDVWTETPAIPTRTAGWPRPVVMYTGTIDERLSGPAIAAIADQFPTGTIALVGPQAGGRGAELAAKHAVVRIVPSVGPHELAGLVADADVCVVPHVRSRLTEAMSPLKIYEYLAAGRPVAATDLVPIRAIDSQIELVVDDADFGNAVQRALARGPRSASSRQAFINDNDWAARCESILDLALATAAPTAG